MRNLVWTIALLVSGLVVSATAPAAETEPIDLNAATLAEIQALPVSRTLARAIWEHRQYVDWYFDVTDLVDVPGMTPEDLAVLRPLVRIVPVTIDEEDQRKDDLFYKFEWWEGAEGTDEALVELYKDLALYPVNVNRARIVDLQNLQNVSPIDAVAIEKHRLRVGEIANTSALRRADGLSGWGYSNARTFLSYTDPEEIDDSFHGAWSLRLDTSPWFTETDDLLRDDRDPQQGTNDNWFDRLDLEDPDPAIYQKLRIRRGRNLEAGGEMNRALGSQQTLDSVKGYVSVQDLELGPVAVDKLLVGSFSISWGQGVVMENTDFRSSRKSGYGFGKRYDGILGDLSRGQEYELRGIASEARLGPVRALGFFSDVDRDAVLNADGSVNRLIRLDPRVTNDQLEEAGLRPMIDQLHERTWGGNVRVESGGNWIGVGGYESRYDRFFDPKWDPRDPTDKNPLVADDDEDNLVAQDNEYFASYKSPGKYRRVYGADFQYVLENLALQGEYAELDLGKNPLKIGSNPSALVLNAFLQYENLNFLVLWRDYDLEFDNPYQRSFSNYERFKGTVLEDYFRLEDPLYGFLYTNSVQPQAERGVYFSTRYRMSEKLTGIVEWDSWRRQGDMSMYYRAVGRLEYRFLFPLRLKIRHKLQSREEDNFLDASIFENVETRMDLEYRLSRFDQLKLFLGLSHTQWPPRGRLQGTPGASGAAPIQGNNAQPASAWGVWYTHNFPSGRIKIDGAFMAYDGFLWFFEKSTFRVVDGSAFRWFAEITDRLSDRMTVRFRYGRENTLRNTNIDVRQFNEPVLDPIDADNVKQDRSWFRLQADYNF
ncbi:MAG: helix-hairpin-helix domain-containing protein [Gemmatimonadetes bacterium]|nr:helix-hairpin-helix domain-containing protein [Gemmatimonadota bacterium]